MNTVELFQTIFRSAFDDPQAWQDWFFAHVVSPADILLGRDSADRAVSALMMQHYDFLYQGTSVPSIYISCVATLPEARSKGAASRLMVEALTKAAERGAALCELIPAGESLYFYYRRFGFCTVFYNDTLRYTSLHTFGGDAEPVEPSFSLFSRLERRFGCGVLHSADDFANILTDIRLDGGSVVAVESPDGAAMLFAGPPCDDGVTVKLLLSDSENAEQSALRELRGRIGECKLEVRTPPLTGSKPFLRQSGMMRIVNVEAMLAALAAAHPHLTYTIRVRDSLLSANTDTFRISRGICRRDSDAEHIDMDVAVDTLAALLFSSSDTGSIFDLPARRPQMALMLD